MGKVGLQETSRPRFLSNSGDSPRAKEIMKELSSLRGEIELAIDVIKGASSKKDAEPSLEVVRESADKASELDDELYEYVSVSQFMWDAAQLCIMQINGGLQTAEAYYNRLGQSSS